jgi:murein DD-endopeptidase MepM/ murein hydrolase activator NlpD
MMKVMLVTARGARTRRYDLHRMGQLFSFLTAVSPALLGVVAFSFGAGMLARALWVDEGAVEAALTAERAAHTETRDAHAREVEALSAQLGELQARLLRLDALGARLVGVAGLDAEEFNFAAPPSQGGAEPVWLPPARETQGLRQEIDTALTAVERNSLELGALTELLISRRAAAQSTPEGMPVTAGWISSYFGRRNDPFTGRMAHHRGVDFAGRKGSPVVAVASGVVIYSGRLRGYGNLVEINHGAGLVTRYGHNAENLVEVGATVERGEKIATMGATGRATGPHLHFEVHRDGRAVDPLSFIASDAT